MTGIEPASPAWEAGALADVLHLQKTINGTREVRTPDLLLARQALSQLRLWPRKTTPTGYDPAASG